MRPSMTFAESARIETVLPCSFSNAAHSASSTVNVALDVSSVIITRELLRRVPAQEREQRRDEARMRGRRNVRRALEHHDVELRHDLRELFEARAIWIPAPHDPE